MYEESYGRASDSNCQPALRPSRTLDPGLGITVKHSFPIILKRHFKYSFNTFGHLELLGALGLLITFPVLG